MARYSLYKWKTEEEGMSHEEALKITVDNFIYYDAPSSRELEYLNKMGIFVFTKYPIRIVKALARWVYKRPAELATVYSVDQLSMVNVAQTPFDSITVPGLDGVGIIQNFQDAYLLELPNMVF
jgi:hypothetical protein